MPYIFQLFAALLEKNASATLPPAYQTLINPILTPTLWEQRGNVPALVRLLSAMLPLASNELQSSGQLQYVLGTVQKLVSAKSSEGQAFDLLEAIVESFPASALDPYWTSLFQVLFTRLQSAKTPGFVFRFIEFYHFMASRDTWAGVNGTDYYIKICDGVQSGDVFKGLYLTIILPESQKIARPLDKKVACVSFTKLLADSEAFVTRYPKGWGLSCTALLKLLENPPLPQTADDAIADHDVDDMGFGVGFTQLQTIKKPVKDPFPEVGDLRLWVGKYLQDADRRHTGRIAQAVQGLDAQSRQVLVTYMAPQ